MKPAILFYPSPNAPDWAPRLRQLCAVQGLRLRMVEPSDLDRTIEALGQGLQAPEAPSAGTPIGEPVLVFCALSGGQLDRLLPALTKMGARGCLKAVLTVHNAGWTFRALYDELVKERLQFS